MSFGKTNYRHGGTRGGADQFKWDDVKNDKYRENYLGHSVHAPVGRWQKGKDLNWYSKLSREDRKAALQEEIALAKQRDQDLMDQALGIAPKRRAEPTEALDAAEVKELLKRGASDREGLEAERVEGLGAAPIAHDFSTQPKKTLAEKYEQELASGGGERDIHAIRGTVSTDSAELTKAEKKQLKKDKKAAKKAKKKEKKERKHCRNRDEERQERGRSRSRSGDRRARRSPSSSSTSSRSESPDDRYRHRRSRSPRRFERRSRSRERRDRSPPRYSRRRSPSPYERRR